MNENCDHRWLKREGWICKHCRLTTPFVDVRHTGRIDYSDDATLLSLMDEIRDAYLKSEENIKSERLPEYKAGMTRLVEIESSAEN